MIVGGIFGPKKSGKTTLGQYLGREYWNAENRRCLVNDPNNSEWGPHFWVAKNEDEFWATAWKTQNCLLICDDAAASIARDGDLVDVFTRINHNGHKLLVIGHSGVNLLPQMREQMDTLYLFKTSPKAAAMWFEIFPDPALDSAVHLGRYEFLYVRQYEKTEKKILTVDQISD